jgi:hypothetical protein
MFICTECGLVFDEPKIFFEKHGLDAPPFERWSVCPRCEENDFVEAEECERCGRLCVALEDGLCDPCYEDLNYE